MHCFAEYPGWQRPLFCWLLVSITLTQETCFNKNALGGWRIVFKLNQHEHASIEMWTKNAAFKIINSPDSAFEFDHLTLLIDSNSLAWVTIWDLRSSCHILVSQAKSLKCFKSSDKSQLTSLVEINIVAVVVATNFFSVNPETCPTTDTTFSNRQLVCYTISRALISSF